MGCIMGSIRVIDCMGSTIRVLKGCCTVCVLLRVLEGFFTLWVRLLGFYKGALLYGFYHKGSIRVLYFMASFRCSIRVLYFIGSTIRVL